jgi:hypothetical protein
MSDVVSYSIAELLELLKRERGQKLQLEVGLPPRLFIKREEFEVDGPEITDEVADVFLRSVADSRLIRAFRERGVIKFFYEFERGRFLVRAKKEDGHVRLHFNLVPRENRR